MICTYKTYTNKMTGESFHFILSLSDYSSGSVPVACRCVFDDNGTQIIKNAYYHNNTTLQASDIRPTNSGHDIISCHPYKANLVSAEIGNCITELGDGLFGGNGYRYQTITSVTIPNTVTSIKSGVFKGCSGLTSVSLPNALASIGDEAFSGCTNLTAITIPNSVTNIGASGFSACKKLTSINIPNGITTIKDHAFQNCSGLTSIVLPNSVTVIEDMAFWNCYNITSFTMNNVISIGRSAFHSCQHLTSVTIPSTVTLINSLAFEGCSRLERIIILATTPPTLGNRPFYKRGTLGTETYPIYVPAESLDTYKRYWSEYEIYPIS